MSHSYLPLFPNGPCGICTKPKGAHQDLPVRAGTVLQHNDLIRLLGHCDGRCGRHQGKALTHNDLLRLYGRCDGSCGRHT